MRKLLLIFTIAVSASNLSFAQEGEDLFMLIDENIQAPPLLPARMVFTQRLLWGEKGVFRTTGLSPLNMEQRQKELKVRRVMLTTHQVLGYATLAAMVAQGIIGGKLYNGDDSLYELHKTMGCLLYTSPSPRDLSTSRMPSSA